MAPGEDAPLSGAAERPAESLDLRAIVEAAESYARMAGQITLDYFGDRVHSAAKSDGTPVTEADREAELALRGSIRERFPDHGILGEEFGETNPDARVRWILDPIDGTRSFMRGVPLYGVLIGVEADGEPIVGVAHFPALDETVAAGRGLGCSWNGSPAQVSKTTRIEDALLLTTDPETIRESPIAQGYLSLQARARYARTWGDCYGHVLVATGRADIMVDPILNAWDAAPLRTIVEEAGGTYTTVDGNPSIHGGSGVSTNGSLHAAVLDALSGGSSQE